MDATSYALRQFQQVDVPTGPQAVGSVRQTSLLALMEIRPELPARERKVFHALERWYAMHHTWPTAYELLDDMKQRNEAFDVNSVRPRLTGLKDRGVLDNGPEPVQKRRCAVTKRAAYIWRVLQGRLL